jgi:replicative DNA helicase
MNQRLLPHSLEAECAVLGSILIDENALLRVSDGLMTEDFYDQRHRWIYEAMLALRDAGVPIDLLTVSNQLETLGHLTEVGEAAYLTGLINDVPTSIHAEHYANTVA